MTKSYFFEDFLNQVCESNIELRELLSHDLVNDFAGFMLHDFVDLIIDPVGWILQFFEKRIEKGEKGVNGGETGDRRVTWEVYHSPLDIFVRQVLGGGLVELLFVKVVKFFSHFRTDRILVVVGVLDSIDRIEENSKETADTFPGIVHHLGIGAGDTRTQFIELFLRLLLLLFDLLENLGH